MEAANWSKLFEVITPPKGVVRELEYLIKMSPGAYRVLWENVGSSTSFKKELARRNLNNSLYEPLRNRFIANYSSGNSNTQSRFDLGHMLNLFKAGGKHESFYYEDSTSGTSGIPLRIVRSQKSLLLEYVRLRSVLNYWGIKTNSFSMKIGFVYVSHYPNSSNYLYIDPVMNTVVLKLNINDQNAVSEFLKNSKFLADGYALTGTPTSVLLFSKTLTTEGLPKPSVCILSGEKYLESVQFNLKNSLGCKTFMTYTLREFGMVAFECRVRANCYHTCDEVFDFSNCQGEILISDFSNNHIPIVKYRTGDVGMVRNNKRCACRLNTKLLTGLEGRSQVFISCPDGNRRELGIIGSLLQDHLPVQWYNLNLENEKHIKVKYATLSDFSTLEFKKKVHEIFGRDMKIDMEKCQLDELTFSDRKMT